MVVLWI